MRWKVLGVAAALAVVSFGHTAAPSHQETKFVTADVAVWFNTTGTKPSMRDAVIQLIQSAASRIDIAIYDFTEPSIRDALIAACKNNVSVRILFGGEGGNDPGEDAICAALIQADLVPGCSIHVRVAGDMHNKYMIVDDDLVLTGSYNWTRNSQDEAQNLVLLRSATIAAAYRADFEGLFARAQARGDRRCDVDPKR